MKYVKMLGLAAVAAMALMALIGASSASATVLCSTKTTPCAKTGWAYPTNVLVIYSLKAEGSAVLKSTSGSIENTCTGSTVEGHTANEGSETETVRGSVEASKLTFTGCSNTTDVLEGGEIEVHAIEGTNTATVTAKGFKVTMNLAGVSCTYGAGAGTDLGIANGGEKGAQFNINAVVNKVAGGFLCPGDSIWEAPLVLTSPIPLVFEPR